MTDVLDIAKSREFEMAVYLESMESMYENAVIQNGEIYDLAFNITAGFSAISKQTILEDSRIIKTLRYAVAPTISQMKFGQIFGFSSIDKFENDRLTVGSTKYQDLVQIAEAIAKFATTHIDRSRFIWLDDQNQNSQLAQEFAKKWTCSIAADQNAQTAYRNWRKERQELAIINTLISMGYVKSHFSGTVENSTDINIGEYTREIKVRGRTVQKADIVFRSKKSKRIALVEAKAVGVELDATKRIKECSNKASDWQSSSNLENSTIIAVLGGFFSKQNIDNLRAANVNVVWEHRLGDLESFT